MKKITLENLAELIEEKFDDFATITQKEFSHLHSKIDDFKEETQHQFKEVNGRLDKVEGRLDRVESQLGKVEPGLKEVKTKVDNLEFAAKFELKDLDKRVTVLEQEH